MTQPHQPIVVVGQGLRSPLRQDLDGTQVCAVENSARVLFFDQAKEHVDIKSPAHRAAAPRELYKAGAAPLIVFKQSASGTPHPYSEAAVDGYDRQLEDIYAVTGSRTRVPPMGVQISAQRSDLARQLEQLRTEQIQLERGTGLHKAKRRHVSMIPAKPVPASFYTSSRKVEELMQRTSKLVAQETMHTDNDDKFDHLTRTAKGVIQDEAVSPFPARHHSSPGFEFLPLYERKPLVPMMDTTAEDALAGVPPSKRGTIGVTAALDERFLGQLFPVHVPPFMHASEAVTSPESPIRNLRPSTCVCTRSISTKIPECTCQCYDWKLRPLPVLVDEDPALVFAMASWGLRRLQMEADDLEKRSLEALEAEQLAAQRKLAKSKISR